jgi:hypothetical protein
MRDSICTGYPTWYKCKHLYRGVLRPSTNVISVTSRLLSFPPPSPFFFSFSFLISSNSFIHACMHPSIHSFNHNTNHYTNTIYNHKFIHISLISSHLIQTQIRFTIMNSQETFEQELATLRNNIKKISHPQSPRASTPAARAHPYCVYRCPRPLAGTFPAGEAPPGRPNPNPWRKKREVRIGSDKSEWRRKKERHRQ